MVGRGPGRQNQIICWKCCCSILYVLMQAYLLCGSYKAPYLLYLLYCPLYQMPATLSIFSVNATQNHSVRIYIMVAASCSHNRADTHLMLPHNMNIKLTTPRSSWIIYHHIAIRPWVAAQEMFGVQRYIKISFKELSPRYVLCGTFCSWQIKFYGDALIYLKNFFGILTLQFFVIYRPIYTQISM